MTADDRITLMERLVPARLQAEPFTKIISFPPHYNPMR